MARLHEHQGKEILQQHGLAVPRGGVAGSAARAREIAAEVGVTVAIKAQVWGTSRAAAGGVRFAETPDEAKIVARAMLTSRIGGAAVGSVLVEERLNVEREFYAGLIVDDRLRRPLLLLNLVGGSGVEERAREARPGETLHLPVSVRHEPLMTEIVTALARTKAPSALHEALADTLLKLYRVGRDCEARVVEINPLALTADNRLVALDCRISVDDYAVFRHPELGIEIARELGQSPTALDRIAWEVERDDYRGTFYFVEMQQPVKDDQILIGFHGAGGGGSMASLDAAMRAGLQPANYTDTSGNPAASKVYRAARIILSQPGIRGYFLSGSGVASQEQFHLARALVKAFREEGLSIPAVLRLGGNGEEVAARIVRDYLADLPAPVEVYQKIHSADFCAGRLRELIERHESESRRDSAKFVTNPARSSPGLRTTAAEQPAPPQSYTFETRTGHITYDHAVCLTCETKACVTECVPRILSLTDGGVPVLNITRAEAQRGKCIECLACEVECWFQGAGGAHIELPIGGEVRGQRSEVSENPIPTHLY